MKKLFFILALLGMASFLTLAQTYTIIVLTNPIEGGEVSGGGNYEYGTAITISATPNEGFNFVCWTEDSDTVSPYSNYTFAVTRDLTLIAHFTEETVSYYNVGVSVTPWEWGTVSGGGSFAYGDETIISAVPAPGYDFERWTKDYIVFSTEPSFSFTVTENTNFIAWFVSSPVEYFDIVAMTNPPEACPVGGGGNVPEGETISVWTSSSCDDGYYNFVNWLEDGLEVSTNPIYTFEVTRDRVLLANFEIYELKTMPTPPDGGTIYGNGNYPPGIEVTLTAVANIGYEFVSWTKNRAVVSTENPYTFITALNDEELVANFQAILGIEALENSISVFPNPTTGELRIDHGQLKIENIEIYDIFGKNVESTLANSNETIINISHLSAGVYFVKIRTEAGEVVKKVLKE
jgi:hypothetical protein